MPSGRSMEYAIWRACERFRLIPSGIHADWDQNGPVEQSMLLAYDQVRQIEEVECYTRGRESLS